jgi:hypothetical protein
MSSSQMELQFDSQILPEEARKLRQTLQSKWWFHRMRRVVDVAMEWNPRSAGSIERRMHPLPNRKPAEI